jgi:ADP-dependent NAD(P)H-hydrate dehydratase / NAD(P)H-hydrate epimerase
MGAKILTFDHINSVILPRRADSHKGDFGHVLVIGGARGYTGAAMLSVHGALRAGAGLVTAAVPKSEQPLIAAGQRHEAMSLGLPQTPGGDLSTAASKVIKELVDAGKISCIVAGPGLGAGRGAFSLIENILKISGVPIVLDADGLNIISKRTGLLKKAKARLILTPHPGEFARLTGIGIRSIDKKRSELAEKFAAEHNVICVLKGHHTIISDGKMTFLNPTGNPGMATGGSGDVLSGMIGAFIAQVAEPRLLNAAVLGVYIHGLSGDMAALQKNQAGLLAGDIAETIPLALKKVIQWHKQPE